MNIRTILSKIKHLPKKAVVAGALVAAVTLPITGFVAAQNQVVMEGHTDSLNVTAGETQYKDVTSAKVDEVVQVQLWQHNRELPDTTFANNNRVKFSVPTATGKTQIITGTSSADNANTISDTTTVNLSMDRARVEFIPGSAMFRFNKGAQDGDASCITGMNFPPEHCYATVGISNEVVNGGVNLDSVRGGPLKGCNAYHETVTIQVRVKADVVSVNKYVRHLGEGASAWSLSTNAKPSDDLEYKIKFKNEGNTQLNSVMVGDNLPNYNAYVAGSTKLYNGNHPDGMTVTTDNINKGGINVGNYLPGSEGYVIIHVKLDPITAYAKCGVYDMRNVGVVRPAGMNEFYNTAQVNINVECKNKPQSPSYSCDLLKAKIGSGRNVNFTTSASANGGATIKSYIYNFGDGTPEFTTDKSTVDHTYGKDGQYAARVKVLVSVNNETKIAESEKCATSVTFTTPPPKPPVTPGQPGTPGSTTSTGKGGEALPNTGPGDVAAIFIAVTISGSVAYSVVARRLSQV